MIFQTEIDTTEMVMFITQLSVVIMFSLMFIGLAIKKLMQIMV